MHRPMRRFLVVASLAVACLVLVIVANPGERSRHGLEPRPPASQVANHARSTTLATAAAPIAANAAITLPLGYEQPMALATDPSEPGVWFLSASMTDVSVFFWNAVSANLTHYSLGAPSTHGLEFGTEASLAVGPSGTVWVGANSTLARLDVATGSITYLAVPTPPDNSNAEAPRPPPLQGSHLIQALAASDSGDVAIAMSASSAVLVYSDSAQTFSTISLNDDAEPLDVAYAPDGVLGVATANWAQGGQTNLLQFVQADGTISTATADSLTVSPFSSGTEQGFASTGGGATVDLTIPAAESGNSPTTPTVSPTTLPGGPIVFTDPISELPDGKMLAATNTGFAVIDGPTGSSAQYQLPSISCLNASSAEPDPSASSAETGAPAPEPDTCQEHPIRSVTDLDGNVWFTSSVSSNSISEVQASEFN